MLVKCACAFEVVRAKERGAKSIRKRVTENFERVCSLKDRKRQDANERGGEERKGKEQKTK